MYHAKLRFTGDNVRGGATDDNTYSSTCGYGGFLRVSVYMTKDKIYANGTITSYTVIHVDFRYQFTSCFYELDFHEISCLCLLRVSCEYTIMA